MQYLMVAKPIEHNERDPFSVNLLGGMILNPLATDSPPPPPNHCLAVAELRNIAEHSNRATAVRRKGWQQLDMT